MKDEYGGKNLDEFVSLKSKIYAISNKSNNEKCINKGHNTFIEVNEFRNTLFQKKDLTHKMRGTKSKNHNIGTMKLIKYPNLALMISDIFLKMELILMHLDIKINK